MLATAKVVLESKWIPHAPTLKQLEYLADPCAEILYGGAAGGGKSDAALMAALMYVDDPGYAALILRRTYPQLVQSGGLIPRSHEWLQGTPAKWNEQKKLWTFPSGATLAFGSMQYENDKYDYQSGEYQFIGFEELTQFTETQYLYLHSRTRRLESSSIPIRVHATANPGGIGHEWVRARFVDNTEPGRKFIAARLADNPHLDQAEYERSLANLDPITRRQLLNGDWQVRQEGALFRREWFEIVDEAPANAKRIRYWDEAATAAAAGKDSDWTCGARLAWADGVLYIEDMQRARVSPAKADALIKQTAELDGIRVPIRSEEEGGASGKHRTDHLMRLVLPGYDYRGVRKTGDKVTMAGPVASQAEAGNVKLVRGPWNAALLDEFDTFPLPGYHDDQIDAISGGYSELVHKHRRTPGVIPKPRGA